LLAFLLWIKLDISDLERNRNSFWFRLF